MSVAEFTTILMIISSLTTLFTEGIKQIASVKNPNVVAVLVSVVLTVLVGVTYPILNSFPVGLPYIVSMCWECILASLCAMVGYDKVIQTIKMWGD